LPGIPEEVHDAITGHRPRFSGRSYGGEVPLEVTAEAMARIAYPSLDLSHLIVACNG